MAALAQDLFALVITLLLSLIQSAYGIHSNELVDGWHSWETAAGSSGRRACCYHVRDGNPFMEACRLGPDGDVLTSNGDCDPTSDKLRVYVLVAGGKVDEIRALSAACPVTTSVPVRAQADKDAAKSIAWLEQYARADSKLANDAVMAIAMHNDAGALAALTAMIEDPARGMDIREQALFWLAQSSDDRAFQYLDRLLSAASK